MSTVTEAAANPVVHKGRWGYHACDYATFLKVKDFHKLVFRDLRATKRLKRWEAKLPKNRVRRHPDDTIEAVPQPKCVGTDRDYYGWVLDGYRWARTPTARAECVVPLDLPKNWEKRHEELKKFYGAM